MQIILRNVSNESVQNRFSRKFLSGRHSWNSHWI